MVSPHRKSLGSDSLVMIAVLRYLCLKALSITRYSRTSSQEARSIVYKDDRLTNSIYNSLNRCGGGDSGRRKGHSVRHEYQNEAVCLSIRALRLAKWG